MNVVRILLLAGSISLFGCASRTPADSHRLLATPPEPAAEQSWPSRWEHHDQLVLEGSEHLSLENLGSLGEGWLYELRLDPDIPAGRHEMQIALSTGPKIFAFNFTLKEPATTFPLRFMYFVSHRSFTIETEAGEELAALARPNVTPVFVYTPPVERFKGTALILSSLDGSSDGEQRLILDLLARGWLTVSVTPSLDRLERRYAIDAEAMERTAAALADDIDQVLAERVYAVEGVLDYLHREYPQLEDRSMIAIGASAGAINLPAVAQRLGPERIDAAVLIGGGADLYRIVTTSSFFRSRLDLDWGDTQPTAKQRDAFDQLVLEQATLDPYHAASALAKTPVLQLHAQFDSIVPASTGDVLYERLGRPERWSYPLGHLGLFWRLPTQSEAILEWLEKEISTHPRNNAGGPVDT